MALNRNLRRERQTIGTNAHSRAAQMIAALTRLGWREDAHHASHKYRAFVHAERPYRYFVGRNGAIRYGMSASNSSALFGGDTAKQDRWLADTLKFCDIGGTVPSRKQLVKLGAAPKLAHRDEDIA